LEAKLRKWFLSFDPRICKVGYLTMLSVSRQYGIDKMTINKYGAIGGMRIGRGNQPPLPQIPHALMWDVIKAAVRGSRRLPEGIRVSKKALPLQTRFGYKFKSFALVTSFPTFHLSLPLAY
jgi:hypothetical protein